jgi:inner membrane protein
MLPDIDIAGSWMSKRTKPLSNFLQVFVVHREIFHTLAFALLIGFLVFLISQTWLYAIIASSFYFLHLLLDCSTRSGINLFWPAKSRIKGRMKTGSLSEAILFVISAFVSIVLIIILI